MGFPDAASSYLRSATRDPDPTMTPVLMLPPTGLKVVAGSIPSEGGRPDGLSARRISQEAAKRHDDMRSENAEIDGAMARAAVKISSKHQIAVPSAIRKEPNPEAGDYVGGR